MRAFGEILHIAKSRAFIRAFLPALFLLFFAMTLEAPAQIDPFPRANFELGFEGPLRGNGPLGGHGFFLWNHPHFREKDLYLRVVISPFIISELVRDKCPAEGHALGISLGGGFFYNNFNQIRNGVFLRSESFWGHGAGASFSYYLHPFKIFGRLPVDGQIRLGSQYAIYQRTGDTDPEYRLPPDTFIHSARVGIRFGGIPSDLVPEKALEFSIWHEVAYRLRNGLHGLPGQAQGTDHLTQQSWVRLGGIMPVWRNHTAGIMMTAGMSGNTDELSCFRMGSGLPFQSEFPFVLHGYYFREIFARSFFLLNTSYRLPPFPDLQSLLLQLNFDYALVDYFSGHALPRESLNGLGADVIVKLRKNLTVRVGYGFGVDAPRRGGFGGHEVNMLFEWKL